ncbi:unnamed protein product [Lactuca virosa]|uniref:RRM domain-containing protein n=1 Tax=Lactuca virosa TaxID=75947 RepID=A0AAU9LLE8_9ASTR|nr:unnamed protein product [Lactuca virosa]
MKGHQQNREWTEVRRRKNKNTVQANKVLTNYYVSGFSDGTRKEELWEPFSRHGKVMDVYFGLKKDLHKRNFAFVRYAGVKDAKEMELKLQGIKCRGKTLEVNISKHQRKTQQYQHQVPHRQLMQSKNMQPNVYHSAQPHYTEVRSNRTYAQAVSNSK